MPSSVTSCLRSSRWRTLARVARIATAALVMSFVSTGFARANETVNSCGLGPNEVFGHAAVFGISTREYWALLPIWG